MTYSGLNADRYKELQIYECGKEKCTSSKNIYNDPKSWHLLHYVLAGKGYILLDGKKVELGKNKIFYVAPESRLHYFADKDNPWSYSWIGFDGKFVKEYIDDCGLNSTPVYHDETGAAKEYFLKIVDSFNQTGHFNIKAMGLLYVILALIVENNIPQKEYKLNLRQNYINQVRAFIANNYQFNITISEIADSLSLSPNYLANIFTAETGESPKHYLTKYRTERACEMLVSSDAPIKDIALAVGYGNQLHFSAEFKKVIGLSPLAYKNNKELKEK